MASYRFADLPPKTAPGRMRAWIPVGVHLALLGTAAALVTFFQTVLWVDVGVAIFAVPVYLELYTDRGKPGTSMASIWLLFFINLAKVLRLNHVPTVVGEAIVAMLAAGYIYDWWRSRKKMRESQA